MLDNKAPGNNQVLDRRSLNRALLARQLLLKREEMSAYDVIKHLVGMQSQVPNPSYFSLWSRLINFNQEDLSRLIKDKSVVRIAMMRSTIHLVTSTHCLELRPILQPVLDRSLQSNFGKFLKGVDINKLTASGRALVEENPCTLSELGVLLSKVWTDRNPAALANVIRDLVPLVQLPPRGI